MPDDGKEIRGPNAAKNRQIVAAARKLFLENGYSATSMDAITKQAAVSKPTLYNHYENKLGLFVEVMIDLCCEVGETAGNFEDIPENARPSEYLTLCGKGYIGRLMNPEAADLIRIVFAESKRFPELGDALWENGPKCYCDTVAARLEFYHKNGQLKISDPNAAAKEFEGSIFGVI